MKQIHYAFVDESGTVMPFSGGRFFVISLVMTANPRPIELHVNRMYKKHGVSLVSGEMKGSKVEGSITKKLLGAIAQEAIIIRQENSMAHKMLQAADFIAWSVYQRYERGEENFYQKIANCIVYEEVIEQTLW